MAGPAAVPAPVIRIADVGDAVALAAYRNQGIGSPLLTALLQYADSHGFARVVLSPSTRSIPFYRRAGFTAEHGLLVRPGAVPR